MKPTAATWSGAAAAASTMACGVGDARRERLLAQHVLAGGQRGLDDLAVQLLATATLTASTSGASTTARQSVSARCEAVPPGGVGGERLVHVGDGDQAGGGQVEAEDGGGVAVGVGVGAADHAGADHRHADGSGRVMAVLQV